MKSTAIIPLIGTSYAGFGELVVLLWIWPLAAGLAVLALILSPWTATRRKARTLAKAAMVVSVIIVLALASLFSSPSTALDRTALPVGLGPLVLSAGVFWSLRRSP